MEANLIASEIIKRGQNLRRIITEMFTLLSKVNTSIYSISASLPTPSNLFNILGVLLPNIVSVLLPNIVGVLGLIWVFKHRNLFAKSKDLSRLAIKQILQVLSKWIWLSSCWSRSLTSLHFLQCSLISLSSLSWQWQWTRDFKTKL